MMFNQQFWHVLLAGIVLCIWSPIAAARNAQDVGGAAATVTVEASKPGKDETPSTDSLVLRETKMLVPHLVQTETKHYVILSDTAQEDTAKLGGLLEQTYEKFLVDSETLGWNPKQLRHKLVAVVFREQGDYTEFAIKHDKVTKTWAVGYYSPFSDRLVFFKSDSGEDVRKVVQQLNSQEHDLQMLEQARKAGGRALTPNQQLTHAKNQIAAEHNRIKDLAAGSFVSTAIHEAAHQLLFHTDIQRNGASYPLWLAEGLATNFETESPHLNFGFQIPNWRRLDAFRLAWEKDTLVPLEIMLTQDRFADGTATPEFIGDFYAQSYAFTHWLMNERPTELRLYLESLVDGSFANVEQRRKVFEDIFGPIRRLERSWVRHEGKRKYDNQRENGFMTCAYGKRVLSKSPIAPEPVSTTPQPGASTNPREN